MNLGCILKTELREIARELDVAYERKTEIGIHVQIFPYFALSYYSIVVTYFKRKKSYGVRRDHIIPQKYCQWNQ